MHETLIYAYGNKGQTNYQIGVIGDIHGKDCWKDIIASRKDVLRWIFLGDYVDSFTIDGDTIIKNLEAIIRFKNENPNDVTLLLGNHDLHYLFLPHYRGDGFRPELAETLRGTFSEHFRIFQIAHCVGSHLFTHAGVSKNWHRKYMASVYSPEVIADYLNVWAYQAKYREALMEVGVRSSTHYAGNGKFGGPIWADITETQHDAIPSVHQVVGHTHMQRIECNHLGMGRTITYCDVLNHKKCPEFLVIEFERKNINMTPLRQTSCSLKNY